MRVATGFPLLFLLVGGLLGPARAHGSDLVATPLTGCDCARFAAELAEARAAYASRQQGVEMPLTPVMHLRYRARVDETYARATCLAGCASVPELDRNRARVLLAESGFKDASLGAGEWRHRLAAIVPVTERCLEVDPTDTSCMLWHAAARGVLARGSWNPLNLRLPAQLLDELHRARGGRPPGLDPDGGATRAEAAMLLKAPRYGGGDPRAGRMIIEEASQAPGFGCRLSNRLVVAEALGRTGDLPAAHRELRAMVDGGLPACGAERYENALSLEEAARCLARLDVAPTADPGWDDDCRREIRQ
ncbi:MAG: hypothetical protein IT294_01100 [Deltaproteobacteria bacterium]|nr:hypothetical protein [Deltaproteobacteria bacterium]